MYICGYWGGGGGGVSITRFSPIYFSAIISLREICISDMKTIPTNFWLFARTTMKYLWMWWMCMLRINHSIPMYIHTGDTSRGIHSDMLLNYSNNMSVFKNFKYKILHLWWTRSGEVGSLEMGSWPMRGGGVLTPPDPPRRSATEMFINCTNYCTDICHISVNQWLPGMSWACDSPSIGYWIWFAFRRFSRQTTQTDPIFYLFLFFI